MACGFLDKDHHKELSKDILKIIVEYIHKIITDSTLLRPYIGHIVQKSFDKAYDSLVKDIEKFAEEYSKVVGHDKDAISAILEVALRRIPEIKESEIAEFLENIKDPLTALIEELNKFQLNDRFTDLEFNLLQFGDVHMKRVIELGRQITSGIKFYGAKIWVVIH